MSYGQSEHAIEMKEFERLNLGESEHIDFFDDKMLLNPHLSLTLSNFSVDGPRSFAQSVIMFPHVPLQGLTSESDDLAFAIGAIKWS
jgi:hypothetical protein